VFKNFNVKNNHVLKIWMVTKIVCLKMTVQFAVQNMTTDSILILNENKLFLQFWWKFLTMATFTTSTCFTATSGTRWHQPDKLFKSFLSGLTVLKPPLSTLFWWKLAVIFLKWSKNVKKCRNFAMLDHNSHFRVFAFSGLSSDNNILEFQNVA